MAESRKDGDRTMDIFGMIPERSCDYEDVERGIRQSVNDRDLFGVSRPTMRCCNQQAQDAVFVVACDHETIVKRIDDDDRQAREAGVPNAGNNKAFRRVIIYAFNDHLGEFTKAILDPEALEAHIITCQEALKHMKSQMSHGERHDNDDVPWG